MFLKKLKIISRTISFRLTFSFCLLFIVSSICVFLLTYSLFFKSLEEKDHQLIRAKFSAYSVLFQKEGIKGLKQIVSNEISREENADYLIRLQGTTGNSLFIHTPTPSNEFDFSNVDKLLTRQNEKQEWISIAAKDDEDEMEVFSAPIENGYILQVGKSTDLREDTLERFRDLFSVVLIISILLSIFGGAILANRALSPIRKLIATIQAIQSGNEGARVENKKTGDELDTLTTLFNEMLDRIQRLIVGMRETLDNVAHDLRTPITRFRVIAEMALQKEGDEKSRKEALEEGLEAASDIQTLLNTLLDISEAEAGAMNLERTPVHLIDICREVIDLYELSAEEKAISIKLNCPEDLIVYADYNRIKQVVANLVDNAIKYTPENGTVKIASYRKGSEIIVSVEDNGQGIPQGEITKIWDRLYRGDSSRSKRGLGLGLSLVRSVVQAHGGKVLVRSEENHGSCFEISLPG